MRHFANFSISDVYVNRSGLLKTLLPKIVDGRRYIEHMDGIDSKHWLTIDGVAEAPVKVMDAKCDDRYVVAPHACVSSTICSCCI